MTPLSSTEQKIALNIARQTLADYFDGREYKSKTKEKVFSELAGVFVTLRKNGKLRGCIGTFDASKPLGQNIHDMSLAAAFDDVRFSPLTKLELNNVKIEISVLSPMKKIFSINEIELSKHGVFIKNGKKSGVFLPQVANDTGWTKEKFLDILCVEKAGLKAGCYLDPKTEMYIFKVQVFEE
jgi:AmmeMemoRadiSam system protein A